MMIKFNILILYPQVTIIYTILQYYNPINLLFKAVKQKKKLKIFMNFSDYNDLYVIIK